MEKKITMGLSEYERIIKENKIVNENKTIITKGNGFYTSYTTILTNEKAIQVLSERVKELETELEKPWWKTKKY